MHFITTRLVRNLGIVALFVAAALFGIASGVLFAFVGDLPQISALDDYSPSTITRVEARDGSVIGDFATERRILVSYSDMPPVLQHAILSAEDAGFFSHSGLSLTGIARTIVDDIIHLRAWGGSTLTQQLAKKLFLTDDKTPERKIKEALLAIQIEKRYTKQEIFTMYCNKMYWGHGAYGVEAASQLYFGKHVQELSLDEAAMIAGIIQRNYNQSPYVDMKAAVTRRNYTLEQMADNGYITAAEAEAAKKRPIVTKGGPKPPPSIAPYFLETVRQYLSSKYGSKALYESGLTVKTGLDPELQRASNAALDQGLRRIDKLRGYRKPTRNVLHEKAAAADDKAKAARITPETATLGEWKWHGAPQPGEFLATIVTGTNGRALQVRFGAWHGTVDPAGYQWTRRRRPEDLGAPGDVVDVHVKKTSATDKTFTADLDQAPLLQGAVLAIDNHTGDVLAMVGGENFQDSQFNRATQALRQVGSLFKPFVYATAIDAGYTATTLLDDTPVSFNVGPNQPPYEPQNYDRIFKGTVPLREALEESRNVPTVRLMDALGKENVIGYARRMGISTPLPPYLSIAIGAAEGNLIEMTSAYSSLPNQGVRMSPELVLQVTDREGNVLEQNRPEAREALRADTAYVLTNILRGVIDHEGGTAHLTVRAQGSALDWPLGGKTGTTDDYTDAWFIGFDPDVTIGVWIGFDQKKTIGAHMEGSAAALPVWVDIMKTWVARQRKALAEPPDFRRPGNVVLVPTETGVEAYIAGTEPGIR